MGLAPLLDRRTEIARLLDVLQSTDARRRQALVVVSGHRRVGKSFLLLHALERLRSHRTVFFAATRQSQAVELERFSRVVREAFPDEPLLHATPALASWEQALEQLFALAQSHPLTVVIDEAPYLERSSPGFASVVQAVWDRHAALVESAPLGLVLSGSATAVMEQMVGGEGPLRGRTDLHLRLQPFDLPAVAAILDIAPELAIEAYAACGGWPLHVTTWDPTAPVSENLTRLAGQPGGILLDDAHQILSELPDGPGFTRVLAAIGRGRTSYGDIASEAGQRIEYPLEFLSDTGLVRRDVPLGAPRRARSRYVIADPYVRFWFALLHDQRARIEGGAGQAVLAARSGEWARHVGWVFEEAARAHARRLVHHGVVDPLTDIGRWWTSGRRGVAEIDVLGLAAGEVTLLGEAKWSRTFDQRWLGALATVQTPKPRAGGIHRWIWTRAEPPVDLPADVRVVGPTEMVA